MHTDKVYSIMFLNVLDFNVCMSCKYSVYTFGIHTCTKNARMHLKNIIQYFTYISVLDLFQGFEFSPAVNVDKLTCDKT